MIIRLKNELITSYKVTVDNMEDVAKWCNGAIKGIKLPPEERVIEVNSLSYSDRAEVGNYIVRIGKSYFVFHERFYKQLFEI